MNFLRWREFHCLAAPTYINIIWLVERLAVRVIPVPGCFGEIDMENQFGLPGVSNAEILEICEFVWSNRIFPEVLFCYGFQLVAPNRKNEFATKKLRCTNGWFHGTETFWKSKISWNIVCGAAPQLKAGAAAASDRNSHQGFTPSIIIILIVITIYIYII